MKLRESYSGFIYCIMSVHCTRNPNVRVVLITTPIQS